VLPGDIMLYRCSLCEGRMNRWRYPAIARQDKFGRQLVIYKCVECVMKRLILTFKHQNIE
jgi:DNA-directed RNA polymerase subunit RPC12/RpoP